MNEHGVLRKWRQWLSCFAIRFGRRVTVDPVPQLSLGKLYLKRDFLTIRREIRNNDGEILFDIRVRPFRLLWVSEVYEAKGNKKLFTISQELSFVEKRYVVKNADNAVMGRLADGCIFNAQDEKIVELRETGVHLNGLTGVRNVYKFTIVVGQQRIGELIRGATNAYHFVLDLQSFPTNPIDSSLLLAALITVE